MKLFSFRGCNLFSVRNYFFKLIGNPTTKNMENIFLENIFLPNKQTLKTFSKGKYFTPNQTDPFNFIKKLKNCGSRFDLDLTVCTVFTGLTDFWTKSTQVMNRIGHMAGSRFDRLNWPVRFEFQNIATGLVSLIISGG